MPKANLKWVACDLATYLKQQRIDDSKHCLELVNHNKHEFLHSYLTIYEIWYLDFIP